MLAVKSKLLDKIEATPVKTAKKVALAYSGGLDSSLCAVLAKEKYHVEELFPITVDVGQGHDEMDAAIQKAKVLGITPMVVDAKEEFANLWLAKAIQANSNYEGYPVSTSMTRQLIASKIASLALKLGCDAIMEGSSGKGNDQYRMHNVFKLFAPQLDVLVPVRDFDLTRGEEEELSKELGIPITEVMQGGDDKTMWCRSLASGAIGLNQPIPENAWLWWKSPSKVSYTPTQISVTFDHGIPVALDGVEQPLPQIVSKLNVIAGSHGIGKIDIFEDGIMGLKSRELYEAPAATVLLKLHHDLEQFCLTKEELDFKAVVAAGVLTADEQAQIDEALQEIETELASGQFPPPHGEASILPPPRGEGRGGGSPEDIHMLVEQRLTKKLGPLGGKLHTGRSRNDQVAVDVRLYVKKAGVQLDAAIQDVQS